MKKYSVGDVVMIPVTVLEVHSQGFPHGVDALGRPNMPPPRGSAAPSAEELAASQVELPEQLVCSTPEGVDFDSTGRAHFKASIAL